jgi:hypothetical protein
MCKIIEFCGHLFCKCAAFSGTAGISAFALQFAVQNERIHVSLMYMIELASILQVHNLCITVK